MESTAATKKWSTLQKIAFRFWGSYFFIYIFPFPLNLFLGGVFYRIGQFFDPLLSWVGRQFLHFTYDVAGGPNGSGDTSYNYAQVFLFFWLAVFACITWSIVDRKRYNYDKPLYLLKVLVRAYLAYYLMSYGIAKIPGGQFLPPDRWRLEQLYGQSSPMGLAWTFFGFSTVFGLFMGFFEALGGVLIMFRRTLLLGACIVTTVTCNIVMINFCFDVPVKLFSIHLFIMSVFIIVTDGQRFINFFLLNKQVDAGPITPVFKSMAWRITGVLLKLALSVLMTISIYYSTVRAIAYSNEGKSRIYGLYKIDEFIRNHHTIPPDTADGTRWKTLEVHEGKQYVTMVMMNGKKDYLNIYQDTDHDSLTLYLAKDSIKNNNMSYHKADSVLTLKGVYLKDTFYIRMHSPAEKKFLLTSRGFHWINEYPFNR